MTPSEGSPCRGRKRRRPSYSSLSIWVTLTIASTATSEAFHTPLALPRPTSFGRRHNAFTASLEYDQDNMENEGASGWISWMVRGSKQPGRADLKMREAEELGGLPRSDRYSSRDWLHNTLTLPTSAILRAILGPVLFMTAWATLWSLLYVRLSQSRPALATLLCLPSDPHRLTVSALSFQLVFKTNSAYQRFAEGRKIWEDIINHSRDLYRLLVLYEAELGRNRRRRLQKLLAAFPYLLRHRIRPNVVMYRLDDADNERDPEHSLVLYQDKAADELDPEAAAVASQEEDANDNAVTPVARPLRRKTRALHWVDKRTLPWRLLPANALEACARAQNRPLWVCDRMAQELRNVPDSAKFTAKMHLLNKVERLSASVGACERIHQTSVPLHYARHSLRVLTLWLFTLPFCLVESWRLLTGPVLFLMSWLYFGVYEIGYSIEDPFQGTLRLSVLCDGIRRDVMADEVIRSTAFHFDEEPAEATATSDTTESTTPHETTAVSSSPTTNSDAVKGGSAKALESQT